MGHSSESHHLLAGNGIKDSALAIVKAHIPQDPVIRKS